VSSVTTGLTTSAAAATTTGNVYTAPPFDPASLQPEDQSEPIVSCTPWFVFEVPDTPGDWWDQSNTYAYNFRTMSIDQEQGVELINLVNSDYEMGSNGVPYCSARTAPQDINLDNVLINEVQHQPQYGGGSFYFALSGGGKTWTGTVANPISCPFQVTCIGNDFLYGPLNGCYFNVAWDAFSCAESNNGDCNGVCISQMCAVRSMCNFPWYSEQSTCAYLIGIYRNYNGQSCSWPSGERVQQALLELNVTTPVYQPFRAS